MSFEAIDLFCGAGGTTTGLEQAFNDEKLCKVIACINHDEYAIKSHAQNHPESVHFTEDIKNFDVTKFPAFSKDAISILWISAECTNFSIAKGGQPRDPDSRSLAEHLYRYVEYLNTDYILVENVKEFMSWGELDCNGKPISRLKGRLYLKWIKQIKSYGYNYDWKLLNSADYGAHTSRTRYFGCFAKKGFPIIFPKRTHSKDGVCGLEKWKAVKEMLDFEDEGTSIFERKKQLCEKTLKRIYTGLVKFAGEEHILKYNSMSKEGKYVPPEINEPCPTITTQNRLAKIKPVRNDEYLISYYKSGTADSVDVPCRTLTTRDRMAKIKPIYFMSNQYSTGGNTSIEEPNYCITTVPKTSIVKAERNFIMDTNYNNIGQRINKPLNTILANRKYHYLISTENGSLAIKINDNNNDSDIIKQIKKFMNEHNIIDIKMRMLKISELLKIQGFPESYELKGTQSQQKKIYW